MFGALESYKDKDFYEEHKTIHFDTLTETAEHEIVAVFKTVAYSSEGFRYYDFVNDTIVELEERIEDAKLRRSSIEMLHHSGQYLQTDAEFRKTV